MTIKFRVRTKIAEVVKMRMKKMMMMTMIVIVMKIHLKVA
jgi:hypothetical protein